ncbi:MAG: hypothetical protein IJQ12_00500 [Lachnospiraceae bacterium]|nr:hypothetical protein [Lachnospiraceae bacterium]
MSGGNARIDGRQGVTIGKGYLFSPRSKKGEKVGGVFTMEGGTLECTGPEAGISLLLAGILTAGAAFLYMAQEVHAVSCRHDIVFNWSISAAEASAQLMASVQEAGVYWGVYFEGGRGLPGGFPQTALLSGIYGNAGKRKGSRGNGRRLQRLLTDGENDGNEFHTSATIR